MRPDDAALVDIAYCCGRILELIRDRTFADFQQDEALREAVQNRLIVTGEAVKRLSASFRAAHADFGWTSVAGLRDILVHAYERVDDEEVWNIARNNVPRLRKYVQALLPQRED